MAALIDGYNSRCPNPNRKCVANQCVKALEVSWIITCEYATVVHCASEEVVCT